MAVCEYCSTRVLKDADAVKDLGKMSSVLEDYSPIQIGTAGVLGGRPFTVVGRIQLRYSAGMWNEWYLLFDDGKTSWLGDSSGMYTITAEYQGDAQLPSFEELHPGRTPTSTARPTPRPKSASPIASAARASCRSRSAMAIRRGGGLPPCGIHHARLFRLAAARGLHRHRRHAGQPAMPAAARRRHHPARGRTLSRQARCARLPFLRQPIKYLPGVTANLVCPSCATQIDAASPKAQVVAAGERVAAVPLTLELGATAKINNQDSPSSA
jgi:hypothetical protein